MWSQTGAWISEWVLRLTFEHQLSPWLEPLGVGPGLDPLQGGPWLDPLGGDP